MSGLTRFFAHVTFDLCIIAFLVDKIQENHVELKIPLNLIPALELTKKSLAKPQTI